MTDKDLGAKKEEHFHSVKEINGTTYFIYLTHPDAEGPGSYGTQFGISRSMASGLSLCSTYHVNYHNNNNKRKQT